MSATEAHSSEPRDPTSNESVTALFGRTVLAASRLAEAQGHLAAEKFQGEAMRAARLLVRGVAAAQLFVIGWVATMTGVAWWLSDILGWGISLAAVGAANAAGAAVLFFAYGPGVRTRSPTVPEPDGGRDRVPS